MKPIKIAQIGVMHDHAPAAFGSMCKLKGRFEVVGVAAPDLPAGRELPAIYKNSGVPLMSVDEIFAIPGLEAVCIETCELDLTKYSLMAAERGLHIQMDKPGGTSLADFERLMQLCEEKKLAFQTGYMYRFNPAVLDALDMIRMGKLGDIICVETHMDCLHTPAKRQWLDQFPGGMMFFLGCHLVDLSHLIKGEPEEVIAMNAPTTFDGVTADDYGFAVFKYKEGVSFAKTSANEVNGYVRRQVVISGTKGTIEIKPLERGCGNKLDCAMRVAYKYDADRSGWQDVARDIHYPPYDRYDLMMETFSDIVRGVKENPYTYAYELATYKLVLRACGVEI